MQLRSRSPRPASRRWLVAPAALLLLLAACGDTDDASEPAVETPTTEVRPTAETPTTEVRPAAETPTTEVATVEVGIDSSCAAAAPGVSELTVTSGGNDYEVRIYVPTSFDGTTTMPLVMNFHGFGSTGPQQAVVTDYEALAETEDFIVVHPTSIPASTDENGRNSWEISPIDDPEKDDVAFADELLDLLIADYCVDETRVYATGMSGGGLFTSQLVCDMSDRLAAAASVSAMSHPDDCDPERAVPYIAYHGTADSRVPFDGDPQQSDFADEPFAELIFTDPIPDEFAEFAEDMGCDPEGVREQISTDVITTTYSDCDDDVPLVFHEITDGGHTWPGTPLAEQLSSFQGYITPDVDATADTWAFFEQHTLPAA